MISFVSGTVEYIDEEKIVIDHDGIGLSIFMPNDDISVITKGDSIKVFTYFSVKEDSIKLYGFLNQENLVLFKLLLGVNKVGPKGAVSIISTCPSEKLKLAIISSDAKSIAKAPGIGAKTAERIVLDLKDKIDIEGVSDFEDATNVDEVTSNDAIEALVALGYSRSESIRAVKSININEDMSDEDILKLALTKLW